MRIIKNIIVVLVSILIFSSCSNDSEIIQNDIIGKWNKYKETKEYQDGSIEEVNLSNCELKEMLELKSNKEVILTRYSGIDCNQANTSEGVYSYDESNNELTLPGNNTQIVEVNGNEMTFKFTLSGIDNYIKTIHFKRVN